ncbi:SAVED domain-containing protein [Oceanobacillus luteolus]|uniref:SAVED domain-containing protein n=1 Tax=Oceanobacillus luteolus TaxID=1274358 RepID=A0ABW4HQS4_9BACI
MFDRESIIEICRKEKLLTGKSIINLGASKIGIRSFSRYSEYLDEEMDQMICLLENFDDRTIKNNADWNGVVLPKVEAFLKESTIDKKEYHLHLETHASIAFLAGRFLEPKSGVKVYPVQSNQDGRVVWGKSEVLEESYPDWIVQEVELSNAGDDIAVVIAVRHKILEDVQYFVEQNGLPIKKLIILTPDDSPGADVIKNGTHAWLLADKLATQINNRNLDDRKGHMHIFMSGPNGLTFFIGQLSKAFGEFTLYEYDLEQRKPGDYRASITFK